MTKEALTLALEALEKLWNIVDDIDTYGDIAKNDEKLYRKLVERRQRTRFEETGISTDGYELTGGAITAIKEALANHIPDVKKMAAQPEQEPVGQLLEDAFGRGQVMWFNKPEDESLLYTTPPQRTWVGLTESDRRLINFQWQDGNGTATEIIDLVEAKLKEKNT